MFNSKKNYIVGTGDPLAPGYSFLDVNSTDTGSDVKKEQVIVEFEVSENDLSVNTYMMKYDTETDSITTDKYLYDSFSVTKSVAEVENDYQASLGDVSNIEGKKGTEFKVPMYLNNLPSDTEIRSSEIVFNIPNDLDVKDVKLNNKVIKADNWDWNVKDGKLRVALVNLDGSPIFTNNVSSDKNIVNLTLTLKEDKN